MEKNPIIHILVPTDFSECADNALSTAVEVAKNHKATITLLHVVQPIPELYGLEKDSAVKDQQAVLLKEQTEKVNLLSKEVHTANEISVMPLVVIGQTVATICETAKTLNISLIVIGSHGIKGFREFLIGSNTYGVTEKSPSPVLSVPLSSKTIGFKKVMFPVRNIPNALDKYSFLNNLISSTDSKLVVYGIYKIKDEQLVDAYKKIASFVRDIKKDWASVKVTSIITDENLAEEVIERAEEMKCDLIVITAKVGSTLKEFFLGKFAQQMVNHSTLPVLHIK